MKTKISILLMTLISCFATAWSQDNMHDSVDALHYDLRLDIGNKSFKRIEGSATVTMRIVSPVDSIGLELCQSTIDSVLLDGNPCGYSFNSTTRLLKVPFGGAVGDTVDVMVFYGKGQHIMPQGWGGFYFDNNIYYNLGIAIYEYPHNVGKAWFPCRDNFYDKATYHFEITAQPGWKAICTGMPDTMVVNADSSSTWSWTLNRQTPTYLVGVAVAPFHTIEREFEGLYATYPAILGFLNHDSTGVWRAYDNMSKVIPMYERCFGPYMWDRVGYVSTPMGSMEHVGNVAFTSYCMSSSEEACLATMSHEFAHSWFGNLVTCASSEDMWINEGGASFCEEVAIQAINADTDPERYKEYAKENLRSVLLRTHLSDNGFKPLYGQTHDYTYGSTVYKKGATVWHSLRGYLGDSVFYASLRMLFDRHAFKNIDSWQLRDSLSLYSGTDLADFFDFHVFTAGFNDFVIDSIHNDRTSTALYMRQKSYGTDSLANGNRVWVSFFSPELREVRRLVTFDGEKTKKVFQLPFKPIFAIADRYGELSKASIGQEVTIKGAGTYQMPNAFFNAVVTKVGEGDSIWLHVAHHWTKPDTSLSPRYIRMADRFWTVTGVIPDDAKIGGRFYYSRVDEERTLDDNLIQSNGDIDLARLLYRHDSGEDWTPVAKKHTGESDQGYFVLNSLKTGEYTLALVDTSYVNIYGPDNQVSSSVRVYPNPTSGKVTVATDRSGEPLAIDVTDSNGRKVVDNMMIVSSEQFELSLPSGSYLFVVRRLDSNEKVTVKVQFMNF